MAKKTVKKPKNNTKLLPRLTFWILLGLFLALVNGGMIKIVNLLSASDNPAVGYFNIIGGSIFVVTFIFIIFMIDFLYIVFFLRWLFFTRKNQGKDKTVYLP